MDISRKARIALAFSAVALQAASAAAAQVSASDFRHVAEVSVRGYEGTSCLTDFPVLVRLSPLRINGFDYRECRPEGLRFFEPDGTPLAHEIDTWDESGESLVWVKVPSLSPANLDVTAFMVCWDAKPGVELPPVDSRAVWSAYLAVWHLNADMNDSTRQAFPLEPQNGPTARTTGGVIGRYYENTTTSQGLSTISNVLSQATTEATVSFWFKTPEAESAGRLLDNKGALSTPADPGLCLFAYLGKLCARGQSDGVSSSSSGNGVSLGAWQHGAAVYGGKEVVTVFLDGHAGENYSGTTTLNADGNPIVFGNVRDLNKGLCASYDELRLADVARSTDWLQAERLAVADRNFCRVVALVRVDPYRDFQVVTKMTVTGYSGSESLYDFPVLVRLSSQTVGPAYASCAPEGLRFCRLDGTVIPHEVQSWDASGESLVWVGLPEVKPVSAGATGFYACWSPVRQETLPSFDSRVVWAAYDAVWHLNGNLSDAKGLGLPFVAKNGPSCRPSGGVLGGYYKNTDIDQGLSTVSNSLPDSTSVTASFWFMTPDGGDATRLLSNKKDKTYSSPGFCAFLYQNRLSARGEQTQIGAAQSSVPVTKDVWHHGTIAIGSGLARVYLDGKTYSDNDCPVTATSLNVGQAIVIGNAPDFSSGDLSSYCELRLGSIVRSPSWIAAETATVTNSAFCKCVVDEAILAMFDGSATVVASGAVGTANDFPVLVRLREGSPEGFKPSRCGAGGSRLRFVMEDGENLDFEVDTWDPADECLVWVRLPTVRKDASFRMYWGFRGADSMLPHISSVNVWKRYRGVWHLNNPDANGVTYDATGRGLKATPTASAPEETEGVVGRGVSGNGMAQGLKIDPLPTDFQEQSICLSAWFKPRSRTTTIRLLSLAVNGDPSGLEVAYMGVEGKFLLRSRKSNGLFYDIQVPGEGAFGLNEWHFVAVGFNGKTCTLLVDGQRIGSEDTGAVPLVPADTLLGFGIRGSDYEDLSFDGDYDELRIAGTARGDAWYAEEARSVRDPNYCTFTNSTWTGKKPGLVIMIR